MKVHLTRLQCADIKILDGWYPVDRNDIVEPEDWVFVWDDCFDDGGAYFLSSEQDYGKNASDFGDFGAVIRHD